MIELLLLANVVHCSPGIGCQGDFATRVMHKTWPADDKPFSLLFCRRRREASLPYTLLSEELSVRSRGLRSLHRVTMRTTH
jgi:hypothetical protein